MLDRSEKQNSWQFTVRNLFVITAIAAFGAAASVQPDLLMGTMGFGGMFCVAAALILACQHSRQMAGSNCKQAVPNRKRAVVAGIATLVVLLAIFALAK